MKLWALLRLKQKIIKDVVMEFSVERPEDAEGWHEIIGELSRALQESRPVILNKHADQLNRFSRTAFLPQDFIESVAFDRMEIEIFPEKQKERS